MSTPGAMMKMCKNGSFAIANYLINVQLPNLLQNIQEIFVLWLYFYHLGQG
ncbi:hypothetical protein [Nostoc sp.]|uniref:hypothetical protein n=1 Tax=Nostoc sp. TaxID=1180 RepID=UPI002FF77F5F